MPEIIFYESGETRIEVVRFACWYGWSGRRSNEPGILHGKTARYSLTKCLDDAAADLLDPGAPPFVVASDQRTPLQEDL